MAGDGSETPVAPVSFDLFGTLVTVDRPDDPAAAVAEALRERGVSVPDDWAAAYAEPHLAYDDGVEHPLSRHVAAAMAGRAPDRGASAFVGDAAAAVRAAFDREVETRPAAPEAVAALAEAYPVGVMSNCSVSGLVERTLDRSAVDADAFDAVVSSVACGRRKPDARAFGAVADALDVPVERLVHVGDDPETDGAVRDAGGRFVSVDDVSLAALPEVIARRWG